jgi:hypothetical protein
MAELALDELVTGKDRSVAADPEAGRIDAAGAADPDAALDAESSMSVSQYLWVWCIVRSAIFLCCGKTRE